MSESWHENRPCDRLYPLDWAFIIGCDLAAITFGGILWLWFYLRNGGSPSLAVVFASLWVLPAAYFPILAILVQRDFAVEIQFRTSELAWRTRSGIVSSIAYSRIESVSPWPRWAAVPSRYSVLFLAGGSPRRRAVWLNPSNKALLDEAVRGSRKG